MSTSMKTCECGKPSTKRCIQCGKAICDACALYYGSKVEPEDKRAKCPDCDYQNYLDSPGGM